jgi:molybdate transport system regulatory protein
MQRGLSRRGRATKSAHGAEWEAKPRWRIVRRGAIALGPGKADLLEAIGRQGSISGAARHLGMSYRRAWLLVAEMNGSFPRPIVATSTRRRAGARLTPEGQSALDLYRRIETKSLAAARADLRALRRLLRPDSRPA